MHRQMRDISQSMIWPKIIYYTKLKLSRIYNHFAQTTYLGQIILLKVRRFKGSSCPFWCLLSPVNTPYPVKQYTQELTLEKNRSHVPSVVSHSHKQKHCGSIKTVMLLIKYELLKLIQLPTARKLKNYGPHHFHNLGPHHFHSLLEYPTGI